VSCKTSPSITYIRGVFKKRPNFLNSAPTSTESALRLLYASSVWFWQQTAMCPVLLSISRWATSAELNTSCSSDWWQSDNERAWRTTRARACVCVCVCEILLHTWQKIYRLFNCLTKHTGRTVWAERSPMSGLSVLKRAECRSVKIPGLDDLPPQQTTTMSREFVLWFVEIVV